MVYILGLGKGVLFREVSSVQRCGSTVLCVLKATPTNPQADLVVNGECVAEYKGEPLRTAGGVVKVRTLTSAGIK